MVYNIGDKVYVIAFPNQEDSDQSTQRPAIIIEDLQDEIIICPITKQIHQAHFYPYSIFVAKNSEEGKLLELRYDSLIITERQEKLKKTRLAPNKIGICSERLIEQIEEKIDQIKKDGKNLK